MRTGEHSPVPTLVQGIGFAPTLAVRCWVIQQRFGEVLQTDHHGRWYTRRLPGCLGGAKSAKYATNTLTRSPVKPGRFKTMT